MQTLQTQQTYVSERWTSLVEMLRLGDGYEDVELGFIAEGFARSHH